MASPLSAALMFLAAWMIIGIAALVQPTKTQAFGRTLFLAGAFCGAGIALAGIQALGGSTQQLVLPIGLPDLPFHVRLDALSPVLPLLPGVTSVGIPTVDAGHFG